MEIRHHLGSQRKGRRRSNEDSWAPVHVGGLSQTVQHVMTTRTMASRVAPARLNRLRSAPGQPMLLCAAPPCFRRLSSPTRHLSSIARYPAIQDFASSLAQSQPSFVLASEKVHILSNPADFYTQLTVSPLNKVRIFYPRNHRV